MAPGGRRVAGLCLVLPCNRRGCDKLTECNDKAGLALRLFIAVAKLPENSLSPRVDLTPLVPLPHHRRKEDCSLDALKKWSTFQDTVTVAVQCAEDDPMPKSRDLWFEILDW